MHLARTDIKVHYKSHRDTSSNRQHKIASGVGTSQVSLRGGGFRTFERPDIVFLSLIEDLENTTSLTHQLPPPQQLTVQWRRQTPGSSPKADREEDQSSQVGKGAAFMSKWCQPTSSLWTSTRHQRVAQSSVFTELFDPSNLSSDF